MALCFVSISSTLEMEYSFNGGLIWKSSQEMDLNQEGNTSTCNEKFSDHTVCLMTTHLSWGRTLWKNQSVIWRLLSKGLWFQSKDRGQDDSNLNAIYFRQVDESKSTMGIHGYREPIDHESECLCIPHSWFYNLWHLLYYLLKNYVNTLKQYFTRNCFLFLTFLL